MENNKGNKSQKTCGIKDVLDIIGGKWAMPIIYNLSKGNGFCYCPSDR
jgi:DNA-binding HxlR family transcriptional regulator